MKYNKLILFGIYFFVFFVPLLPGKIKISVLPVSADFIITGYLCIILMLMLFSKYRRDMLLKSIVKFGTTKIFIFSVIYSTVCVISLIPAVDKIAVVTELMRYWTYIVLFFAVITFVKTDEEVANITKVFLVSVAIAGIIGLIQYLTKSNKFVDATMEEAVGRVYSTFVNPNYWGAFVNIMLYPLLMLAFKKVKHYKLIYLLCIILLLNLVLTFTRGSWLAFMVGLFIFIMLYRWKLVVLAAAVMPLGLFIPGVSGRLASIFDTNSWTIVERFRLWKTGYLMFKDHPIIGVGNGNYLSRYNEYIKRYPELDIGWEKFSVHNSYLKVLSETGILGFAPFILVVFFFVKEIIHIWKNGRNDISKNIALAFLCSIASYLFQNISNNLFFIPQVNALYWIIGGIIIAYNNIGTHKDNLNNL